MKKSFYKSTFFGYLLLTTFFNCEVANKDLATSLIIPSKNDSIDLVIDLKNSGVKIQPTMYGVFFEDINFAADGGLYAEMVKNRSFEFLESKMGWWEPNSDRHRLNKESGFLKVLKYSGETTNHNYARIDVKGSKYELVNEGYRGMGIKENSKYNLTLDAKKVTGNISKIIFQFIDSTNTILGETKVIPDSNTWKNYEAQLIASKTELKARLKIIFEGNGTIDVDMISLFPEDTWKGRKKGLRKDLVELLDGLKPGFLRFPGGCIVEGRVLERRYQWKKTIGNIRDREILVNRWNTEFMHKFTPDYFQSFGLGFFEYFQLSEDLGAEPLPILSCGMACQFNTGELIPMGELEPYIQDALDLIEFANGATSSAWGRIRAEMGHPEPFNMKYIGIGNEQWGPDYIERYKAFDKAIKEKYPEIIIVSGSGPFPDGDYFDYGWDELRKMNAQIVDEHYYRSPQWFLENADRYDSYDRNGPKVFAGEYAAHPSNVEDGPNENNVQGALAEAAFMTGLERNAEVVNLTSYAPLMAHSDAFQWAPDLIWFNNLESYGTVNYYVQKLFSNNAGTDLVKITKNDKPLIGQGGLYASAVKNIDANELIIKVVNIEEVTQVLNIKSDEVYFRGSGTITSLSSVDTSAFNSFETPNKISPKSYDFEIENGGIQVALSSKSFNVIKIKL